MLDVGDEMGELMSPENLARSSEEVQGKRLVEVARTAQVAVTNDDVEESVGEVSREGRTLAR